LTKKDLNELCNISDIEGYLKSDQLDTMLPLGLENDSLVQRIIRIPIRKDVSSSSQQLSKTLDEIPLDDLINFSSTSVSIGIIDESDANVPYSSNIVPQDVKFVDDIESKEEQNDHNTNSAGQSRVRIRYPTSLPLFSRSIMDQISKPSNCFYKTLN
jgi:hypothetical protein